MEKNQIRNSFTRVINETGSPLRKDLPETHYKAGIVGGGQACHNLLQLLCDNSSSRLKLEIAGIADINPDAPGISLARENGTFTTKDFHELFNINGLNLIIELTGIPEVADKIAREKPEGVSLLDHFSSHLIWEFLKYEIETDDLEKNWEKYIKWVRK
ncbi:MAG: hypothetical protein PVG39_30775, partial [Desulfobacteraceae bacterium]